MKDHQLVELANFKMPFGKYENQLLVFIPESYIIWMLNQGKLSGSLKDKFLLMKEIKDNGLEQLLHPLIKKK
jgi:uncharacterized protein (DUF3820 family)